MRKGDYLEDLIPGRRFYDCVLAIRSQPKFYEANGKKRAVLNLSDSTGIRPAVRWDVTEAEIAALCSADVISISGTISGPDSEYPNQITILSLTGVTLAPEDHAHFCEPLAPEHEETLLRFQRLRARVGEPRLVELLARVFDDERFWPKFETAVAAGVHHHAFPGGLLLHTVEVGEMARAACQILPFLRHDLIVTAALLHDIGKVYEMEHGLRAGEYTTSGNLIGHVHDGAFRVQEAIKHIRSFPAGLRNALIHLMLSHHETAEWGSPKAPALPEAVVLAQCDQISAHATEWHTAKANARAGEKSVLKSDGRRICVEDLDLDTLDLSGLPDPISEEVSTLSLRDLTADDFASLPDNFAALPLRGLVAAGDADTTADTAASDDHIVVALPAAGADYLVRVTGDSMVDAGIRPGDLAYVRSRQTANSGDIVIAHLAGSGELIKRYEWTPKGEFLCSENAERKTEPAYHPIPITADTVRIQGIVTRIERDLARR